MNVIMDHDHIYHAHRTRSTSRGQKKTGASPRTDRESYDIEEWATIVERQVREIPRGGGVATILMHPLCMHLADGFATRERLLASLALPLDLAGDVGTFSCRRNRHGETRHMNGTDGSRELAHDRHLRRGRDVRSDIL